MANEEHWTKWWASLHPPCQQAVIILAEMRVAAKESLDDAVAFKASKMSNGEWERVNGYEVWEQPGFEEWLCEKATLVDVVSGNIRLAVACSELWRENDYARQWGVFHAVSSGDSGVKDMVWERQGRRWEWMAGHDGGFVVAGRELVALGHEKVGRVLMQNAHLGEKAVAMRLALYGGTEMEGEVRDVIGIEPYGGGLFEPAIEYRLGGSFMYDIRDTGDGRIVTLGDDCLKVWDSDTGKCLNTLAGYPTLVLAVVMVGSWMVVGDRYETLRIADLIQGENKNVIDHPGIPFDLARVNPSMIVSCGSRGGPFVWRVGESGELTRETDLIEQQAGSVFCVISLGNNLIASGSDRSVIFVHNVASGTVVGELKGHRKSISDLAILPDGRLVSTSSDGTMRIWSASYTGDAVMVLDDHQARISSLGAHEDGIITLRCNERWLRLWSVEGPNCRIVGEVKPPNTFHTSFRALSGDRVASVDQDNNVTVWSLSKFNGSKDVGHFGSVSCGAVLDNASIVSGGGVGEVVVWRSAEKGGEAKVMSAMMNSSEEMIQGIEVIKDGFVLHCEHDNERRNEPQVWKEGKFVGLLEGVHFHLHSLKAVGGGCVVVGLDDWGVNVWDVEQMKLVREIDIEWAGMCMDVVDSSRVVVGGEGHAALVNTSTGMIEKEMKLETLVICSIVWGEGRYVGVTSMHEVLVGSFESNSYNNLIADVVKVWAFLGHETVLVATTANEFSAWNWKTKEREVEFRGLNGKDVADVAWDASRRLAVFFMREERCWIAYEL